MKLPVGIRRWLPAKSTRAPLSYSPAWIAARKTVQALALLTFLALLLAARWTGSPWQAWTGLFFKLDPLAALASWLHGWGASLLGAGEWVGAGIFLWLSLFTVSLTLLAGRAWCGWLCPLGTLLDWLTPRRSTRPERSLTVHSTGSHAKSDAQPPERLRRVKYILLFLLLFSALFGSLAWMVFDPLTLLERTLTHSAWPALDWTVRRAEETLYHLWPASGGFLVAFESWARPRLLPDVLIPRRAPLLFAVVCAALFALNWIAPRFWCRYLCPLGGLLGLLSKAALLRRHVRILSPLPSPTQLALGEERVGSANTEHKDCTSCKLCSSRCPTATIDPQRNFTSDPAECTLCLDCLDACPRNSTYFAPALRLAPRLDYDPDRRTALFSLGGAALSVALLGSSWLRLRLHPARLRPPGVKEEPATDGGDMPGCIRCGVCLQACPTSALQPAFSEASLEGLWTPVIIPRLGYCDFSCNACGQVCPVGAIPALSLEQKRLQVIGKAYIDQDRCLAWADGTPCIVCEEMCPLPDKAITWDEGKSVPGGEVLQRPVVDRQKCIGCGICEYKCPLPGLAAIQVFAGEF